jgi:hypothetical protein
MICTPFFFLLLGKNVWETSLFHFDLGTSRVFPNILFYLELGFFFKDKFDKQLDNFLKINSIQFPTHFCNLANAIPYKQFQITNYNLANDT